MAFFRRSNANGTGPRLRSLDLLALILPLYILLPLVALPLATTPRAFLDHLLSEQSLQALSLTIRTTLLATAICILLGTPLAYVLARRSFPGRELIDTCIDLPIAIPPVVGGVALLLAFGRRGLLGSALDVWGVQIPFTWIAVVMAQVFIASPFYVKTARAGFETVPPLHEHVAGTLGASPWRVFFTVTIPLARPALIAGTVLAWARALSEFGATIMFAGNFPGRTQTLSLAVMSAMESDLDTAIAISLVSIVLAFLALIAAKRYARSHHVVL
jgi:molybdate transport system permease protein